MSPRPLGGEGPLIGPYSPSNGGFCPLILYLDLDLIGKFFGEAMQLPNRGVHSLDHHPQPSTAFHSAMHVHGKVVL